MHWTEPATAEDSHSELEKTLWDAANQLWANAALKPSEFSPIVLGLIFLRYADVRFPAAHEEWDEEKELGRWVNTQRIHYRRGDMKDVDRIRRLEELGFVWNTRK